MGGLCANRDTDRRAELDGDIISNPRQLSRDRSIYEHLWPTDNKGYTIVATGVLDAFTRKYMPMASISRKAADGKRWLHILDDSPQRFLEQEDAAKFALSEAQKWVDERVK